MHRSSLLKTSDFLSARNNLAYHGFHRPTLPVSVLQPSMPEFLERPVALFQGFAQPLFAAQHEPILHHLGLMGDHIQVAGGLLSRAKTGHLREAVDGGFVQGQKLERYQCDAARVLKRRRFELRMWKDAVDQPPLKRLFPVSPVKKTPVRRGTHQRRPRSPRSMAIVSPGPTNWRVIAMSAFAAEDAIFGNQAGRVLGILPTMAMWPALMGPRRTKEFFFTGDTFTGKQALERGLVSNRIFPHPEARSGDARVCAPRRIGTARASDPPQSRGQPLRGGGRSSRG